VAADQGAEWTIRTALEWTEGYLRQRGDEKARLAAQWLLSHATKKTRLELYLDYDRLLSLDERAVLREGIRRRETGEPLQYICGVAPFRRLVLGVRPGVLIPRPETELLVGYVLSFLGRRSALLGQETEVPADREGEAPAEEAVEQADAQGLVLAEDPLEGQVVFRVKVMVCHGVSPLRRQRYHTPRKKASDAPRGTPVFIWHPDLQD
jgi:release factor glutamine methyltransferase